MYVNNLNYFARLTVDELQLLRNWFCVVCQMFHYHRHAHLELSVLAV